MCWGVPQKQKQKRIPAKSRRRLGPPPEGGPRRPTDDTATALTLQAAGHRPQHTQQHLPPAEEPHVAGRTGGRTVAGPATRPKVHRCKETRVALLIRDTRGGQARARARWRHLGYWRPPRAPSWSRAARARLARGTPTSAPTRTHARTHALTPRGAGGLALSFPLAFPSLHLWTP